ncbi:DUF1501 domain-containing protein [Tautonia sociabilis]|uniref:DUF1501 domain-containing protein n=1 Tax=Tautonia sociabilis TaxID=2080755 RepID=A0A432MCZ0_9BACT|nr:DUF1501 domain-containing protein [Tautonia sociabilis]RUL81075.1 DUF1501 domain-containing protein [Tautonia sociabilis]
MEPLNRAPGRRAPALDRRRFLTLSGLAGLGWLTPASHLLARQEEQSRKPAQSIILIWLDGGPSQLETFDPHPDTAIAAGTRAIPTAARGVLLAEGFEGLAEEMGSVALVRSVVGQEGDHERGVCLMKTGYRPDPTAEHPSIGAICCHHLPVGPVEIPRHISILPGQWPSRGGFLGPSYDAFQVGDPKDPLPDVLPPVPEERDARRVRDLEVVERAFASGRAGRVGATFHREAIDRARAMMSSEQLAAFDVSQEPESLRRSYGETPFGRACLAARRLTEVGVRCVEVTLGGWDSHVNNHEIHRDLIRILDPALSALIRDLRERGQLDRTAVLCAGEFGRTPKVNPLGGRDHWPGGFSVALAGGGLRGGVVVGETDPEGVAKPAEPVSVADLHATLLTAVGLDPAIENPSAVGRPIKLSEGRPIAPLF